jgi:hypothetical protein
MNIDRLRLFVAVLLGSCVHQTTVSTVIATAPPPGPNELSSAERALGWTLLFDGRSFSGWHGLGLSNVPQGQWVVESGVIRRVAGSKGQIGPDGKAIPEVDLVSDSSFQDFELAWEWKISDAGNSGLKYNISETLSASMAPHHSAVGWEYQMNDDERNDDNKLASHRSGALYDVVAPIDAKPLHPAGEWNRSAILLRGNHGEHWLNGVRILQYDLGTASFDSAFAASKYMKYPAWFATRRAGSIALQDHGDAVWFRNIKIRVLK